MPKATRKCRICGATYEACRSYDGTFQWQVVACCPEHGSQYLEKVLAARARDAEQRAHAQNGTDKGTE